MEAADWIALGLDQGYLQTDGNRVLYVPCDKSYIFTDPEEQVRAATFVRLIEEYRYPVNRLDTEVLGPRRRPMLPADIVVYSDDDREHAYIVVETKAESSLHALKEARRQGLDLAFAAAASTSALAFAAASDAAFASWAAFESALALASLIVAWDAAC
jgi:Type I restriction enzyme R protein N terminus (HSDR_N)